MFLTTYVLPTRTEGLQTLEPFVLRIVFLQNIQRPFLPGDCFKQKIGLGMNFGEAEDEHKRLF